MEKIEDIEETVRVTCSVKEDIRLSAKADYTVIEERVENQSQHLKYKIINHDETEITNVL